MSLLITTKPGNKYRSIKNPRVYEALRKKGMSKQRAARISNAQAHKDAGADAGVPLHGPGGLLGTPGMGARPRKWGNRKRLKDCTCGMNVATKEQIAPGITRIRGNLCNVHGRYGPCDAGASKKRVPKGRTRRARVVKPKLTAEQRAQQRQQQQAENRSKVFGQLGLPEGAAGALENLRSGKAVSDDGGLVKLGLAEQAADGSYRLTPAGRAVMAAAGSGDAGRARDVMSGARDRLGARQERQTAAGLRKQEAAMRRQAIEARRKQREAERAARAKKGGGGKGGKGSGSSRDRGASARRDAERADERARRQREHEQDRAQRQREHAQDRAQRQREHEEDRRRRAEERAQRNAERTRKPSPLPRSRGAPIVYGRNPRATTMPVRAHKSFVVYKDASGVLRWLARSTTAYRDRDREILPIATLDADSQRMTEAGQFGPLRWWHLGEPNPLDTAQPWGVGVDVGDCDFSTQIGTTRVESGTFRSPALAQRIAETADEYELSPGFFHPYGLHGPSDGIYQQIRTFERSLVPTKYGRASNLFTGLTVKEFSMDPAETERRFKAAIAQLQLSPEQASALAAGLVQTDKSAQSTPDPATQRPGVTFKSDAAPQVFTAPDGTPGIIQDGRFVALKAGMAPASMEQAGATEMDDAASEELDDGADNEATEEVEYMGDMTPANFETMMLRVVQAAIQQLGNEITTRMAAVDEAVKGMGYARTKAESATATEIAALKARLAELEGNRPAVTLPADVEAALKSTGPQTAPAPGQPQIPADATTLQQIAARTMPQLYTTGPGGQFGGWTPPVPPSQS